MTADNASSEDLDIEDAPINAGNGELKDLGGAEFERILNKRKKYGLVDNNELWPYSMRLIQLILCIAVCVLVVVVTRQMMQSGGHLNIRKRDGRSTDRNLIQKPRALQPRKVNKALMDAREKGRKINKKVQKQIESITEHNMDPRLKAKLAQWKGGQLTNEEMMGRTPKSLLNFRNQPSPGEVPHNMFNVPPPDITNRYNPLASMGRNRYPFTTNTANGLRPDPRLGVDPRARQKKLKDPRLQRMPQIMNNRNRYNRNPGGRGRVPPQVRVTSRAQGHNHQPRLSSRDPRFKASPSMGGGIQKHPHRNSGIHSEIPSSLHRGRSSSSSRHG